MLSMLRRYCSLLLAGALSLAVVAFAQDHSSTPEPHWTYSGDTGPAHWGELSSEFSLCKDGKEQSPLNIVRTKTEHIPELQIASHPVPLSLVDNGHTIRQNYAAGNGNTLTVRGKTYELTQFHFHHPSEETIDGKHRDMVVHLVYASKDGNLAVIGVLVKEGKPNSLITRLWSNLPKEKGNVNASDAVEVNAIELIPARHSFYEYEGSLTTPPCTQGVMFFIMDTPMEFSRQQIATFAAIYPDNARPTQPLNGRVIEHEK